jgi:hypothetical protein
VLGMGGRCGLGGEMQMVGDAKDTVKVCISRSRENDQI